MSDERTPADEAGIVTLDSATHISAAHRGCVIVAASHGGIYPGYLAASAGVRGIILNDAGMGLDEAGIGSLAYLEKLAVPACAISHWSARIGDGADMIQSGVVSVLNLSAARLGCAKGQRCIDAAQAMRAGDVYDGTPPVPLEGRYHLRDGRVPVLGLDSASLVRPDDTGSIIIAGSHGGVLGGRAASAIKYDVVACAYHDAGIGKDRAGVSRLPALDERRIPAVTVAACSARIGDARSIWATGRISVVNKHAAARGVRENMDMKSFADCIEASMEKSNKRETL